MVTREELRPYVSLLLATCQPGADSDAVLADVINDVADLLDFGDGRRELVELDQPDDEPTAYVIYTDSRPPTWAPEADLVDVVHHLVVVRTRDELVAIYTSDTAVGRQIARHFDGPDASGLSGLRRIPEGTLNRAFGLGPSRTLWLSGIHRRSTYKPDSKILAGRDLRDALDPLGDQSYYFTAARADVELVSDPAPRPVGFAPRKSRAWAGPSRDWQAFTDLVDALLLVVLDATDVSPEAAPLPILAIATVDPQEVESAYDLSVIAPTLLTHDELDDPERQELAERWADATFTVTPRGGADFDADVSLLDKAVGTLMVSVTFQTDGTAELDVTPASADKLLEEARKACLQPGWATVRYESGHTISAGAVYSMRLRGARFDDWSFSAMDGIEIGKEKPVRDNSTAFAPELIGESDSLFDWVLRSWPPDVDGDRPDTTWLVCDDGAMEIADFIAIDLAGQKVTLIHVKASGSRESNRQVSVSDYEVVVGQAVKNLRLLDRVNLADGLESGIGKAVEIATWKGVERVGDRTALVAALRDELGENHRREAVIVQPRVTKTEYDRIRGDQADGLDTGRVRRMEQLDTLLVGAQADCRNLGARLRVYSQA